jgi:hypothetical protein
VNLLVFINVSRIVLTMGFLLQQHSAFLITGFSTRGFVYVRVLFVEPEAPPWYKTISMALWDHFLRMKKYKPIRVQPLIRYAG